VPVTALGASVTAPPPLVPESATSATPPSEGVAAPDARVVRLVLGVSSLTSLVVGVLAVLAGVEALRWPTLLYFCAVGVGSAPWQLNPRLGLSARLTLTGVTTFAVWTLPTSAMVIRGIWHPALLFAVVAVACAPLHVLGVLHALRQRADPDPGGSDSDGRTRVPRSRRDVLRWATALLGSVLCLVSAATHQETDPGFWGFLPHIGVAWYVGLAMILGAFVSVRRDDERLMAVTVLLLLMVLTLTPALVYDSPGSQSAFKHVDLIRQITESARLDASVGVYTAWPGFFSATAWVYEVTGIRDLMQMAVFWPPIIGLFRLVALWHLASQFLSQAFQRWVAVALAILVDSSESDYFSPQSVGFVLSIAAFGLAVSPGLGRARTVAVLAAGCTITVTHQLSPYVAAGVLIVLAAFRQVRPWTVPLLVLIPALAWTALHRASLVSYFSLSDLGRVSNFRPPKTVATPGLERLPVIGTTAVAVAASCLLVGLLALAVVLRNRRDRQVWALACCPAVGLGLVAVNPYGQEGVFRAILFALPWLCILAARAFPPSQPRAARPGLLVTVAALTVAWLVSACGLDAFTVSRPGDVAAVEYPATHGADEHATLILGGGDLPNTLRPGAIMIGAEDLFDVQQNLAVLSPDAEVNRLTANLVALAPPAPKAGMRLYALWSPTSANYSWAYGLQSPEDFVALRSAFDRAPYWDVVLDQDGTVLFEFDRSAYPEDVG
jgi:hypothetical protein